MKIAEIRVLKTEELHGELDRLRRHQFDLRSQAVTEKLGDPTQLGKTRRDIARIFSVLRERGETEIEQKQYHLESVSAQRGRGNKA
ncbi:MAG: 50S ribosomal protein L29 [Phycisphaerae bacterium]